MRVRIDTPASSLTYRDIAAQMRQSVKDILDSAVIIAQNFAPGDSLKKDIAVDDYREFAGGARGSVGGPYKLIRFTLPPGTVRHFIPGGLAVNSYGDAAAIQLAKGYPMKFYWERIGMIVHRWSVSHPGYKGSDWGERVFTEVEQITDRKLEELGDYITERWGEGVQVSARNW